MDEINYDALKKRGFLRQKQDGFFVLRARNNHANFSAEHLEKLIVIAKKYAHGFVHVTVRQGIEIPYIKYADIDIIEQELKAAGLLTGTSGPRLRTTTTCPGNNWCKSGLVDTFKLYDRIEQELNIRCAMDLPHKFKIAISGCPNTCTRPQQSEVGIHGTAAGYVVYLGGCGGKTPRIGFKLEGIFSEDQVLGIVAKVVKFFKDKAKPKQRLALLIEDIGKDNFLKLLDSA